MRNSKKTFFVLLCAVAVLAFGMGVVRLNAERSFMETALPVDAYLEDIQQITEEDGSLRTVVTVWYLVDGVEYHTELAGYHPSMKDEKGKINAYYQPEEPDVCYVPGTLGYAGMFWTGGALTLIAGVWIFWKNPFKKLSKSQISASNEKESE